MNGADLGKAIMDEAELSEADLSGSSLEEADLSKATLFKANLSDANLRKADLSKADLSEANLSNCNLQDASLCEANLFRATINRAVLIGATLDKVYSMSADFRGSDLSRTWLEDADLSWSNFSECNLTGANLSDSDLTGTNLSKGILRLADLSCVTLVRTNLEGTDLTGCRVYGLSAWDLKLEGAIQKDLLITPDYAPSITVDNLEVAQFIYLLLNNQKIRHVIDTITSKVVLILGRFTPDRKAVLDAIRDELRRRDYLPVLFDFEKPSNRDITETVSTLAHMARFVIADITDAKSIPQELMAIVPALPSVPVQPLLLASQREYGMFEHFRRFPWVLEPFVYEDQNELLAALTQKVIGPAEAKVRQLNR